MGNQTTGNSGISFLIKTGLAILVTAVCLPQALAQPAGEVVEVSGQVEVKLQPATAWQNARVKDALDNGDEIQTQEGKSTLLLSDESMLKLNRNTYMRMREVSQTASWRQSPGINKAASPTLKSIYRLFKGEAWLRNNNQAVDVDVITPTVTASLRGTELHIEVVSPELVKITVLEGAVLANNASGSIQAVAGELIVAPLGRAPTKQTLLSPEDSVQWTVRVPNIIETQDWVYASANVREQQSINALFNDLSAQNISAAQQRLNRLQSSENQRFASLAGLIDMSAGNHSLARQAFLDATKRNPNDSVAWRGLALTSLLVGNKAEALDIAQSATPVAQKGSVDWLLLSYIERANFDLPAAELSAQKAIAKQPNSVLALTNLSLLQFADDRVDEARETVKKALALAPQDSLALSMLGFIQLGERHHQEAGESFARALQADPANSEAYLGASLLAQREGRVLDAQQSLATAIALEPQRSLFLSYWAKALHQERRFEKALTVLDSAERLDTQDPTPHYYRAIIEQDLFRAGESINSLQNAISLNDQRAVYRSRLLLDRDLAARNFDLANVYGALGLNLLATQKAVESTLDDFRNFSAHLFLSRALSLEGRAFPADSEVLVSGLLLPTNANSLSTINDYSVFFESPEVDSSIRVQAGSDNTYGATGILSGVMPAKDFAYSAVASYRENDDFTGRNNSELKTFSNTLKWQLNENSTIRTRINLSDSKTSLGELIDLPNLFRFRGGESSTNSNLFEVGVHTELSNRSDLLLNLRYFDNKFNDDGIATAIDPDFEVPLTVEEINTTQRETVQIQGQYSIQVGEHQLFTGLVHQTGDQTLDRDIQSSSISPEDFFDPEFLPRFEEILDSRDEIFSSVSDKKTDQEFTSLYIDDVWKINSEFTLQAGLYAEDFDNETTQESAINPRLGMIWKPTEQDTFRLAGFRYILPQVQGRLHPTYTAGVFITRNTEEGALVEELNLIWERNWQSGIFTANIFDLDRENREQFSPEQAINLDRSSLRGISFGLNQQLGNRFGVAASLSATELRDDLTLLQIERDEINAELTLTYVSPTRFSASIVQSFRRIDFFESTRGTESIPLTDLFLRYTFKDRKGDIFLGVSNLFEREFVPVFDAFSVGERAPAREILASMSWNF